MPRRRAITPSVLAYSSPSAFRSPRLWFDPGLIRSAGLRPSPEGAISVAFAIAPRPLAYSTSVTVRTPDRELAVSRTASGAARSYANCATRSPTATLAGSDVVGLAVAAALAEAGAADGNVTAPPHDHAVIATSHPANAGSEGRPRARIFCC